MLEVAKESDVSYKPEEAFKVMAGNKEFVF